MEVGRGFTRNDQNEFFIMTRHLKRCLLLFMKAAAVQGERHFHPDSEIVEKPVSVRLMENVNPADSCGTKSRGVRRNKRKVQGLRCKVHVKV
jgi:hypothetical protein